MISHPVEWLAAANAVIDRGTLERRLGVNSRYGEVSYQYGPRVRDWPVQFSELLAYAEERVLSSMLALRTAQGLMS